jgi:hypothetical protein
LEFNLYIPISLQNNFLFDVLYSLSCDALYKR